MISDSEILERFKKNDHDAISDFYEKHKEEFVHFTVKKFNLSMETSREIYQEAFLSMYQNILSGRLLSLSSTLKTYLFQVGKYKVFNELKRSSKHTEAEYQIGLSELPVDEILLMTEQEKQMKDIVSSALLKLSAKCRRLLSLYYLQKKKYDEIMELMDYKSIDSVKTQKYKCFKKIESLIKTKHSESDF